MQTLNPRSPKVLCRKVSHKAQTALYRQLCGGEISTEQRSNNNTVVKATLETLNILITNYNVWRVLFPHHITKQHLGHYVGILKLNADTRYLAIPSDPSG